MRVTIPEIVLDHMAGAEIYAFSNFHRNSPEVQDRAREDAQFLLDINLDGYEDYIPKGGHHKCMKFLSLTGGKWVRNSHTAGTDEIQRRG